MKLLAVLLMMFVCISSPAFGSIVGDTIHVDYIFPTLGTVLASADVVVPGSTSIFGALTINIQDDTFTLDASFPEWSGSAGFNGLIFTDTTQVPNFTSFHLDSITGFPPPVDPILSFNANQLIMNFNATAVNNMGSDNGAIYNFSFADQPVPVPVPGAAWLLGSGLLSLAGWRRFRKS
jgi:hypothetical protein